LGGGKRGVAQSPRRRVPVAIVKIDRFFATFGERHIEALLVTGDEFFFRFAE
jgi:hypothetical protein